jgi:hypothetical protein
VVMHLFSATSHSLHVLSADAVSNCFESASHEIP